ncbi:SLOG family protein [Pseudomonas sp. RL_15y_Pfl2_60]|uniref:SLOG family protein n=1 Tax=Pseudomonas sp. RL_15y_Pfl2_60 TaxID=3088709 RepID=UPI0030DA8528
MPVKIIVCGGHKYKDGAFVYELLDYIHRTRVIAEIIRSNDRGTDQFTAAWAKSRGVPCTVVEAQRAALGDKADDVRNKAMLDLQPDGMVAFPSTHDTYTLRKAAEVAGVPIHWVDQFGTDTAGY